MKALVGFLSGLLVVTSVTPALAYVGPGVGITLLWALWAVLVALALTIAAILYWPLRVLLRKVQSRRLVGPVTPGTPTPPRTKP